jgi:hypothetical protein
MEVEQSVGDPWSAVPTPPTPPARVHYPHRPPAIRAAEAAKLAPQPSAADVGAPEDLKRLMLSWRGVGNSPSSEWRLEWCQFVIEQLRSNQASLKPIDAPYWPFPKPQDLATVRADDGAAVSQQEHVRRTERAVRLGDARDESLRRLRVTLTAEAWLRAVDVTHPAVERLALWHRQVWGIETPVSDDYCEREQVAIAAVAARVR